MLSDKGIPYSDWLAGTLYAMAYISYAGIQQPPLMSTTVPVMFAEASLARKDTAAAMSYDSEIRPVMVAA